MHTVLILACCAISMSVVSSNITDTSPYSKITKNGTLLRSKLKEVSSSIVEKLNKINKHRAITNATHSSISLKQHSNKNRTFVKTTGGVSSKNVAVKLNSSEKFELVPNSSAKNTNRSLEVGNITAEHRHFSKEETKHSFPLLQKFHARITRSKDAVWATITLTFICVLLVLAVAQSRMWKDHYYTEAQGVPLPNFNERVLFKDVMEHKVASLKQFFKKKKSKNKNETELESLLPPGEWDD